MGKHCLLVCLPLAQLASLYSPRSSALEWYHPQWTGMPTSISSGENSPPEAILHQRLPQMTLTCVKLTAEAYQERGVKSLDLQQPAVQGNSRLKLHS